MTMGNHSYTVFPFTAMSLDPIHVGTGGTRLGRVDNTIVRDPVTQIPKIPGSSVAGVMRAYTAMAEEKYPNCAGLGRSGSSEVSSHCGKADCLVCTVFGFAKGRGESGGFAGLASFSDMHVLLFPVASHLGRQWVTSPIALRQLHNKELDSKLEAAKWPTQSGVIYRRRQETAPKLNLGWLYLKAENGDGWMEDVAKVLVESFNFPAYLTDRLGVVSDKLFAHVVNSNLEVRTSVAIDPATGAAEDQALFTYEALPRSTVLYWELTCRNPKHFKVNGAEVEAVDSPYKVKEALKYAHDYIGYMGIGGMGSRGMGRLRVFKDKKSKIENQRGRP